MLKKIEQDRKTFVDIGKITKRQLELAITAIHNYASDQASFYHQDESDNSIHWDNYIDLQQLEKYLWEIVSDYKGWKKVETNK
ncbi:MAG: hypothetical protein K0S93_18 [Nitrososphaeraceae archaeon]|jgi:hypothetical protein|nr:hypothetical protein [Nitrososphaeraceae archaeon]